MTICSASLFSPICPGQTPQSDRSNAGYETGNDLFLTPDGVCKEARYVPGVDNMPTDPFRHKHTKTDFIKNSRSGKTASAVLYVKLKEDRRLTGLTAVSPGTETPAKGHTRGTETFQISANCFLP